MSRIQIKVEVIQESGERESMLSGLIDDVEAEIAFMSDFIRKHNPVNTEHCECLGGRSGSVPVLPAGAARLNNEEI